MLLGLRAIALALEDFARAGGGLACILGLRAIALALDGFFLNVIENGPIAGNKNPTNASKRNPTKKRKRLVRHEDGIAIYADPGGSTRV